MVQAQTERGINLHQSLTTAFDPITILQQSQQFLSTQPLLQDMADSKQPLSEHESLYAVKQALEQRENLPRHELTRCYGCGMTGHFATSCSEKVSGILPLACFVLFEFDHALQQKLKQALIHKGCCTNCGIPVKPVNGIALHGSSSGCAQSCTLPDFFLQVRYFLSALIQ
jgi:hypothetical protein